MVLAQYYNLIRYGRPGYEYVIGMMKRNTQALAEQLSATGDFELISPDEEQLPLVAFRLAEERPYDEFDIAWQLAAERGWMVPAYTLPPNAERVKLLRALVKETLSRGQLDALVDDIRQACATLDKKGGVAESERKQVKTGTGY
jgi:glutamate decarboxylase